LISSLSSYLIVAIGGTSVNGATAMDASIVVAVVAAAIAIWLN
jgi:hypothetical protein